MNIIEELKNSSGDNRELLERAAAEIERLQKELEAANKISVQTDAGKLVAEVGGDPDYPEIFVYLEKPDGTEIDLAVVGQPSPESRDIRAGLYTDWTGETWEISRTFTWSTDDLKVNPLVCAHYDKELNCCKLLSDWTSAMPVLQPCIEGPCEHFKPQGGRREKV